MAAGSDLLDEVFFNTEVDEKVVSDLVGSLESELSGSGHGNSEVRGQALGNHIASPGIGGNANVQESKIGLVQEVAKTGTGVQGGVINNTRSQGSAMDPSATGTASTAGSETSVGLGQGKAGAVSASVTAVPNHGAGKGVMGTSTVQTLNGSNVINSHNSGSSGAAPAVTIVNNGPGSAVKGNVHAVLPSTSSTVIQTSFMNTQSVVSSTVISSQASGLSAGPTVTLVRPPMQTAGSGAAQNGNNTVLTSAVNLANLPSTVASGIPLQTQLLNSNQSPVPVSVSAGAQVKSESPKTITPTPSQAVTSGVVANAGNLIIGQPTQSGLQPATLTSAAIGKNPALPNALRTATTATVAAGTGGIRTIAPQVLAPRIPQAPQNQPNIQNFQLPPGMVLVRSDSGQLLMIHQQTLAQMQAQSQSQSAMAPRPATPTSTPPVQIASVQAPGTPIMARQVTPTTIIKQASGSQTPVQATTTLQRPPVLQNPIVLGGAATATSVGTPAAVQPGAAQRTVTGTPGTTLTTTTETLENVKKCKNFLSTLIKLASSGKQSSETTANVKELVKNLLEGKMEAEDFTSRLYRELNSSPQPYLVPFLKRSLPALRQLTPDSAAFIQQSQLQQTGAQPSSAALTTVVLSSPAQRLAGTPKAPATPQQPVISLAQSGQGGSLVLQQQSQQQQGAMVRPPQVTLTQSPVVTLRPPHSRIVLSPQPLQVKQLQTVPLVKPGFSPGGKTPSGGVLMAAQQNKAKDTAGTFRDDDDINDVASMAGVNLSEESARILATNSELVGTVTRSCKDEAFLYTSTLHRRVMDIGKRHGIVELGPEVVNLVSHATQQRLQTLLEKVTQIAQQKNFSFKEDSRYEQISDVRSQLKFFEQLDQMEKQRKEEQEREILMKAAKSRSRQEDPEQLRLKQKAKEMQQQEQAQMRQRDANLTALAAIGPRKKRKLESQGGGAGAEGPGSSPSLSGNTAAGPSRQFTRQRITRVNLRDLLFCLENERGTSHSHLLYRAFLK